MATAEFEHSHVVRLFFQRTKPPFSSGILQPALFDKRTGFFFGVDKRGSRVSPNSKADMDRLWIYGGFGPSILSGDAALSIRFFGPSLRIPVSALVGVMHLGKHVGRVKMPGISWLYLVHKVQQGHH